MEPISGVMFTFSRFPTFTNDEWLQTGQLMAAGAQNGGAIPACFSMASMMINWNIIMDYNGIDGIDDQHVLCNTKVWEKDRVGLAVRCIPGVCQFESFEFPSF